MQVQRRELECRHGEDLASHFSLALAPTLEQEEEEEEQELEQVKKKEEEEQKDEEEEGWHP